MAIVVQGQCTSPASEEQLSRNTTAEIRHQQCVIDGPHSLFSVRASTTGTAPEVWMHNLYLRLQEADARSGDGSDESAAFQFNGTRAWLTSITVVGMTPSSRGLSLTSSNIYAAGASASTSIGSLPLHSTLCMTSVTIRCLVAVRSVLFPVHIRHCARRELPARALPLSTNRLFHPLNIPLRRQTMHSPHAVRSPPVWLRLHCSSGSTPMVESKHHMMPPGVQTRSLRGWTLRRHPQGRL